MRVTATLSESECIQVWMCALCDVLSNQLKDCQQANMKHYHNSWENTHSMLCQKGRVPRPTELAKSTFCISEEVYGGQLEQFMYARRAEWMADGEKLKKAAGMWMTRVNDTIVQIVLSETKNALH